jgi:protein phosphatase
MFAALSADVVCDRATWSEQGPRRYNADAAAYFHCARTGRIAVAVADGVGDSQDAAWAARLAADHAVRIAALGDGPGSAIESARDVLRSASALGDAATVVAVSPSSGMTCRDWSVAWVGDCRGYAWRGTTLRLLTRDQTVAQALRARRVVPAARWEHVLTNSVRTTDARSIDVCVAEAPDGLVLLSDGVYRPLTTDLIAHLLVQGGTAAEMAARLTTACRVNTTDNATTMVLQCQPCAERCKMQHTIP